MKTNWNNTVVEKFEANDGTIFTRGPFEVEYVPGKTNKYDYKLEDKDGIDYCTISQMNSWNVKMAKVLV